MRWPFAAVQFSAVQSLDRLGRPGRYEERYSRRCLPVFFFFFSCRMPLWAVLARSGLSTFWCCPSSIFSADHCGAHPLRCNEGWFWRDCRGVLHARTMQVFVSWQLPEEVPAVPQGSWSRSAPSRWSCGPSRKCGEVNSSTWFRKPIAADKMLTSNYWQNNLDSFVSRTTDPVPGLHLFIYLFITSFIPCGKFGLPYLGKATTAAARAALPIPNSACGIFVCPNKGMAADAWDL